MRIATWNVNSLKMRLPHVLDWLGKTQTDILCLQELKMTDDLFPAQAIEENGYGAVWSGQKTYNGVAILYRKDQFEAPGDVQKNIPGFADEQKRLIAATFKTAPIYELFAATFPMVQKWVRKSSPISSHGLTP